MRRRMALAICGSLLALGCATEIRFQSRTLRVWPGVPCGLAPQLTATIEANELRGFEPRAHLLVQLRKAPDPSVRQQLAAGGVTLLDWFDERTWRAAVRADGIASLRAARSIRWAGLVSPLDKAPAKVRSGLFYPYQLRGEGRVGYRVSFYADVSLLEVERLAASLGGRVAEERRAAFSVLRSVDLEIPPAALDVLLAADLVAWVEPASPPRIALNLDSQRLSHVDDLHAAPYGLSGEGVRVGVWDEGTIALHHDLTQRVEIQDQGVGASDHATHVAGTVAGNGRGDPSAEGMAPAAILSSYDWNDDVAEMIEARRSRFLPPSPEVWPPWERPPEVDLSSHSYSPVIGWYWDRDSRSWRFEANQDEFGAYTGDAHNFDRIARAAALVIVVAAGNDRSENNPDPGVPGSRPDDCTQSALLGSEGDCIGPLGAAKNVITVGAVDERGEVTGFTSWGPTDDGRIKPDLMANGTRVLSTVAAPSIDSDGDGQADLPGQYGSKDGTSMATPAVSGAVALLMEQARRLHLPALAPSSYKALLIHSARDIALPGPDFRSGWGLLDARAAADLLRAWPAPLLAERELAREAESVELPFCVPPGVAEAHVTLAWDDPEAPAGGRDVLVNDLDLSLVEPGGTRHSPWWVDPALPAIAATRPPADTPDQVNNVEQVSVLRPTPGLWHTRVVATRLAQPPQRVSIVGVSPEPDADQDGVPNCLDNCAGLKNPAQADADADGKGDECDEDDDNDGIRDEQDNCPRRRNPGQEDLDQDRAGDACDWDDDNDCVRDENDNCPREANCNFYGAKADHLLCPWDPCLGGSWVEDINRLIAILRIECSPRPVDTLCIPRGCPMPEFEPAIDSQARQLLVEIDRAFHFGPGGFRRLKDGRVVWPSQILELSIPRSASGGSSQPTPPPVADLRSPAISATNREIFCRGLLDQLEGETTRQRVGFRSCVDRLKAEAELCQVDSDHDGRGDACEAAGAATDEAEVRRLPGGEREGRSVL